MYVYTIIDTLEGRQELISASMPKFKSNAIAPYLAPLISDELIEATVDAAAEKDMQRTNALAFIVAKDGLEVALCIGSAEGDVFLCHHAFNAPDESGSLAWTHSTELLQAQNQFLKSLGFGYMKGRVPADTGFLDKIVKSHEDRVARGIYTQSLVIEEEPNSTCKLVTRQLA